MKGGRCFGVLQPAASGVFENMHMHGVFGVFVPGGAEYMIMGEVHCMELVLAGFFRTANVGMAWHGEGG